MRAPSGSRTDERGERRQGEGVKGKEKKGARRAAGSS